MLPLSASITPARPAVGMTTRSAFTSVAAASDLLDRIALSLHARKRPLGSVLRGDTRCASRRAHMQQRDRHAAAARNFRDATGELDRRARIRRVIYRDEHVVERKMAVLERDDVAIGVVRHEQRHGLRRPCHGFGHRSVHPARGPFAALGCYDEKIRGMAVEPTEQRVDRHPAVDGELRHLHSEVREHVLLCAAWFQKAPALERLAHGREAAPALLAAFDVQQREAVCRNTAIANAYAKARSLAGEKSVGWTTDWTRGARSGRVRMSFGMDFRFVRTGVRSRLADMMQADSIARKRSNTRAISHARYRARRRDSLHDSRGCRDSLADAPTDAARKLGHVVIEALRFERDTPLRGTPIRANALDDAAITQKLHVPVTLGT